MWQAVWYATSCCIVSYIISFLFWSPWKPFLHCILINNGESLHSRLEDLSDTPCNFLFLTALRMSRTNEQTDESIDLYQRAPPRSRPCGGTFSFPRTDAPLLTNQKRQLRQLGTLNLILALQPSDERISSHLAYSKYLTCNQSHSSVLMTRCPGHIRVNSMLIAF